MLLNTCSLAAKKKLENVEEVTGVTKDGLEDIACFTLQDFRSMGKTREHVARQLTKVRNKNVVIAEARNEGRKVHFATAAQVMVVKSRLPGCAGQAADEVSAYTQIKVEGAPSLLKIPKSDKLDSQGTLAQDQNEIPITTQRRVRKALLDGGTGNRDIRIPGTPELS